LIEHRTCTDVLVPLGNGCAARWLKNGIETTTAQGLLENQNY